MTDDNLRVTPVAFSVADLNPNQGGLLRNSFYGGRGA